MGESSLHIICVAPMMGYTDRHFLHLLRIMSKHAVLYTEMITAQAIVRGDQLHLLSFSESAHPVAVQLGGSDPGLLSQDAKIAAQFGYDEINLNVGCPSERVQSGCFGAALMKTPDLVADIVLRMRESVSIPVTVKTRLGVDDCDSDYFLQDFVGKISEAGCKTIILHARKAWLKGLSPKENREIPPLQYDRVYRIKQLFPRLEIIMNGGIKTHAQVATELHRVDGAMVGRVVCSNPYWLSAVDQKFYGSKQAVLSREEIVTQYLKYVSREAKRGVSVRYFMRHLTGLYQGELGAKAWRREMNNHAVIASPS